MVQIDFVKESDQDWVRREVAPYDIFSKSDKNGYPREVLLGYCWQHENYKSAPIFIYLDTISNVVLLNKTFNGQEVVGLIKPKHVPNVTRDW